MAGEATKVPRRLRSPRARRGELEDVQGRAPGARVRDQIRHVPERSPGVDVVVCPPFVSLEATLQGLGPDSAIRVYAQNVHWELEGAFTGEVSAPMLLELGVDGAHRRSLGAPSALRRDGRDGPPARGGCARGGPPRHRVHRRDRSRARGRRDGDGARAAGRGDPAPRAPRHRLRARLGDRNRQDGDAGDRAGGARVRQDAPRRPRALRRLGEARERGRRFSRCRTWTARSSAAPRSTSCRSRRSVAPAPRAGVTPRRASSSSTAGGSLRPGRETPSSSPTRRSSTRSGPATRTRRSPPRVRRSDLPAGQMGNSEVGHLTIGSGRILLPGSRAREPGGRGRLVLRERRALSAFRRARERDGDVHLLGLVSYGGVHSHIDHLRALLELAEREGMAERTWIHAFTDGRDVSPHSAERDLAELPAARIATVCGRYYAMDRDNRWERTDRALAAIARRRRRSGRSGRGGSRELRARE